MSAETGAPAVLFGRDGVNGGHRVWLMPYLVAGAACIISGGVLAAATAYVSTEKTAWATAYLVLVGGVAQVFLGAAVTWLTPTAPTRNAWLAWVGWNVGNAGVLAGQLTALIALTDVGTALLVVALVLVLASGHGVGSGLRTAGVTTHRLRPRMLLAFRIVVLLLAVSMVVGVILAHVGA